MKAIIINLAGFVRPVLTTGLRQPPPSHSDWNGMGEVKPVSEVSEVSPSEFPLPLRCDVGPPANPGGTISVSTCAGYLGVSPVPVAKHLSNAIMNIVFEILSLVLTMMCWQRLPKSHAMFPFLMVYQYYQGSVPRCRFIEE